MYCSNCGTQLPENARFCLECGTPCSQQRSVVVNDSVVKDMDASTHMHTTDVGGANVAGNITIEADKRQVESCPVCGKNNDITETFTCVRCKKEFICMIHHVQIDGGYYVCAVCAEQIRIERERKEQERIEQERAERERKEQEIRERLKKRTGFDVIMLYSGPILSDWYDQFSECMSSLTGMSLKQVDRLFP